jgi:hydroxyacylglutathione hydrolase
MRIHPLACGFGVAFLLEAPNGLFLIDGGSPGEQERVLQKMKELRRNDLKLIWITHAHYDHYGSAAALRELTEASIGVHPADAGSLINGKTPLGTSHYYGFIFSLVLPMLARRQPLPATSPDFTLEDGETLDRFGLNASVLHTPGHTPGHTCLLLPDGTAFAGDLIGRFFGPRLQYLAATDWSQLADSLRRFQAVRPEWIYTGHSRRPLPGRTLQRIYKDNERKK